MGFGVTYEGLKPPSTCTGVEAASSFGVTYEGLKRRNDSAEQVARHRFWSYL